MLQSVRMTTPEESIRALKAIIAHFEQKEMKHQTEANWHQRQAASAFSMKEKYKRQLEKELKEKNHAQ